MPVCELVGRGEKRTASSTECVGLVMAFAKRRCTLRYCKLSAFRSKVAAVELAVLEAGDWTYSSWLRVSERRLNQYL